MMGSEVKGAEGGGDALSLGENIQLNMDDAAKVRANLEAAARVKAMAADETLKFNSEEGAIMNNNNTTKMTNTMGYRDIRQPNSPSRPDDDDDDDDDDYKAVFNKLPSPCRPDSPVLPPIDYGADRIQNDLLDEICSDIGIKDDMDFDFLDFEVNPSAEPVARNQFDHEGSLDQIIQFGQSQEGPDSQPTSSSTACYPSATVPYTQGRPPSRTSVPQSPSRVTQRQGSQSSDHSNPHLSGTDHLQRMAQLNASIAGSPAKSTLSHVSQMTSQSQKIKMEAPGSPKPSMAGTSQSGLMVPSSPSVKQRMSSHIPSTSGASGQYQTPGQMPSGQTHMSKSESGNLSYPPRPPSLQGQPGRTLESPFDHGYFSVGSNAGSGSHDSIESGIPRLTPPPDEQTANDKVLQYLGQQSAQGRMGMANQGMPGSGRPGMQGSMGPRMPGSGAMSHFNAQMPPQQQMPTRHPPDQMFNYRPQHPQSSGMRGMAPYHRGQGPGAGPGGVNFGVRAPQNSFHPPQQSGQSQGFNFEHPMSQRYPSPYSNHPNYGQTPVNVAQPKMSADFSGKGYNFQNQNHPGMTPGGPYPNFSSTQSSPDGYERSSMNRAKKQRLDSNAYQGKPQGLQYEPPTTLSQPLVDMKGATMFNPRLPHSGQPPGCPAPGQQMYPGQPPMRGQYPQYNQTQTPHGQQSQFPVRPQSNFGPPTNQMHPGQQMTVMNQGPNAHSGAPGGSSMQMGPGGNFGNKSGLSISQSYASLQAQLPPFQPGTQDFVQHLVTDRSSAFRSHPLFPLLRDLVIADMNFHSPTFPFQLISNLPADFNKLLQNYMQRNPASANYRMNEAVDNVIMDALRYAHKAFIEKITQRKRQHGGQGQKSFNAIEEFCERFDKAVKNTLAQNQEAGGTQPHNPGMPPDGSGRLSHCGPPPPGSDGTTNSLASFGNAPGNAGPPMGNMGPMASNMQNTTQGMYQSSTNSNMPGRPSSASGVQWNAIPAATTAPPSSLPSDMMQNQQNCASLPNLTESSVNQSIDLLADIMGGSSSNQSKPPMQNTNTNNANGGAFGAIMSEQLSSSMPGGLNNIEGNGGYTNSQPGYMNGPAGGMQRHMSVPAPTTLLDSGRPTSLPNVADPPPTPPPDHLLQHTDQSKQQMMNIYSNITTTSSSSMPNLAQQVPGVNYPRYLSNNTPSPLDDSMHSTVDADSMYGDHFADIRPSPRKGEGHKKQVLPKEAVAIMLEWLKEHQDKPYPNDDEKDMLIRKTKLTMSQINYWFTNARRRILPKWTLQRLLQEQSASGKMNPITIKQCQQLLGTKSIKSIKEALQKDINLFAESTPSPGSDT